MPLSANTRLGPYEVLEPLQSGGMGEVYKARDTHLNRTVALKVLRSDLVGDTDAISRFQREARLASSLNHPHIVSIYSTQEHEGLLCIAMELVDGETLSQWVKSCKPPFNRLLDVFIQVADALASAHAAGIVHRDIKPSNILVNSQGYVKVLDFGLAKHVITRDKQLSQISTDITGAAEILGTPAYMSPEQAAARAVDGRTDVFSLGVVMFEAATGKRPFVGESAVQLLHAVLHEEPPNVAELNPGIPSEFQWVLERALAKDPGHRYSTIEDLAKDLRRLRSKETTKSIRRPSGLRSVWKAAFIVAVVSVVGIGAWLALKAKRSKSAVLRYERLTEFDGDGVFSPVLSPDGRMVAFVRGGFFGSSAGRGGIYVKLLPDGQPTPLTQGNFSVHTPAFTPDGSKIIYTRVSNGFTWDSWQVPVLGGETSPFMPNASGLTFLPGGNIMFAEIDKNPHMAMMVSGLNRVGQRTLYAPDGEGTMAHRAALSPDGKWVLIVEMDGTGWTPCRLVPFDGSSKGYIVGPRSGQCTVAAWSPDGEWMYFSSNVDGGFQIWREKFPSGEPEKITPDANEHEGIAFAPDGKSFITSVGTSKGSIWLHDKQGEHQLTFEGVSFLPRMSPDGKTVYFLRRARSARSYISADLYALDVQSKSQEKLFPGFVFTGYDLSPDGKQVLFTGGQDEKDTGIWVANLDRGSPPSRLTKGGEFRALFGGSEIIYLTNGSTRYLETMKTDGTGVRRIVPENINYLISVSPDGAWAAVAKSHETHHDGNIIRLYSLKGDKRVIDICDDCMVGFGPGRQDAPLIQWTPDGKQVLVSLYHFGLQSNQVAVMPFDPKNLVPFRGAHSDAQVAKLPGVRLIPERNVFPAIHSGEYLIARRGMNSNLFRVVLED